MTEVIVGKWSEALAIPVPTDLAAAIGLRDGDSVQIEVEDGTITVRRIEPEDKQRQAAAREAAESIIRNRKNASLNGLSIRDLIEDGRRG